MPSHPVPFPASPAPASSAILASIPKSDRAVVLSFIDMSSRKAGSAEEVFDSICLSILLKQSLRGTAS